jgi:hypothetical protein
VRALIVAPSRDRARAAPSGDDVVGERSRVVADPVDEARLAAAQEVESDHV